MQRQAKFDGLAVGIAMFIAAFFALTARFNSQPAPSFVPAAVLSATGCGLLVTALRKMRGKAGVGVIEAGVSGFMLAFLQFVISFTYPGVFTIIRNVPPASDAFLLTWGLIGFFTVALSIGGAALGHLIFAPSRPGPAQATTPTEQDDSDEEEDEKDEELAIASPSLMAETTEERQEETENSAREAIQDEIEEGSEEDTNTEDIEEEDEVQVTAKRQPHILFNYTIGVLLIGLSPMVVGYVFAAAYDFTMNLINVQQLFPGFYPTLSLLSGLLPWRLAVQINLANANGLFIVFTLLWRIPDSVLGNPNILDVQALEPLLWNAAALAILLFTMYQRDHDESKPQAAPWGLFIGFEALLGLSIILPSNFWLMRGLEGILQFQGILTPLPALHLLDTTTFVLNIITGVVFSVLVGLIVRRQYQLWTHPRAETPEEEPDRLPEEETLEEEPAL